MNGHRVLHVSRHGTQAIHFVESNHNDDEPLTVGQEARQIVDWARRFDNMQQHTGGYDLSYGSPERERERERGFRFSGQHLISAVLEKRHNISTTSWWMAESDDAGSKVGISSIELDRNDIPREIVEQVELECNQAIRDHLDVQVKMYELNDPELNQSHTRGLPEDLAGPIRVVNIGGDPLVDSNLCCGTHVNNLAQLQIIKLVSVEKGKKVSSAAPFSSKVRN